MSFMILTCTENPSLLLFNNWLGHDRVGGEGSAKQSCPVAMVRILPPRPISSCQCDIKGLTRLLKTGPPGHGGSSSPLPENEVSRLPPAPWNWLAGRSRSKASMWRKTHIIKTRTYFGAPPHSDFCENPQPGLKHAQAGNLYLSPLFFR